MDEAWLPATSASLINFILHEIYIKAHVTCTCCVSPSLGGVASLVYCSGTPVAGQVVWVLQPGSLKVESSLREAPQSANDSELLLLSPTCQFFPPSKFCEDFRNMEMACWGRVGSRCIPYVPIIAKAGSFFGHLVSLI